MFHIVLVEPEIPQNTGNISRTCAVTGCALHLVHPLGFSIDDRHLKRAGLDYWKDLDLYEHSSFREVEERYADHPFFLFSTHAERIYSDVAYPEGSFLVFGKETAGLGPELLNRRSADAVRIPMLPDQRSLNLSNSVAIALYEALRQNGFAGLL
ncbi:MAG: tRNA (cytidine(34)-2'-O)-methyltransferase [Clostridia bacterium]|nr:tRNA (cytidine(34)-2'-O)-methyltransferase [Clostridia bacterium]MBR0444557.1 tRNA (cytidine(34)-2'-O)-methyltransferase [Clostridia bacterium]